jgi:hypothetical protein
MDDRIGILNSGTYYAYVNGYNQEPVMGTLEEIESALGIRQPLDSALGLRQKAPVSVRKAENVKTYIVRIVSKYPSYNEPVDGSDWECIARDANDAIKQARKMMHDGGHTRQDGTIFYKARIKKD